MGMEGMDGWVDGWMDGDGHITLIFLLLHVRLYLLRCLFPREWGTKSTGNGL